jgi:thiamine kinase-like enzyme
MIPSTVKEITGEWLNDVLPEEFGEITGFTWVDLGEGVGILGEVSRLNLIYAPGQTGPATLISKCQSPAKENISLCQTMGYYLREVNFYEQEIKNLPVNVPACYFADIDDEAVPFVLLLEEIPEVTIMDQITGADIQRTASVFSMLAKLHAHYWETDALYALEWLPSMNNPKHKESGPLAAELLEGFRTNWGSRVSTTILDIVAELIPRYADFLDWAVTQGNQTFAHNDARCENYLLSHDGSITMIDFQYCTRFWGVWDISNWLSASLTVEDRRRHDKDLVNHYYDELVANGVKEYSIEQCWLDLKASLMIQTVSQIIDNELDYANERGEQLLEMCITRTFTAAEDYELNSFMKSIDF